MYLDLSLVAILLTALERSAGSRSRRRSAVGQGIATVLLIAGALAGRAGGAGRLATGTIETSTLAGPLPELSLHLRLDPLAAFFLVPVYVLGAAGTLYGGPLLESGRAPRRTVASCGCASAS